MTNRGVNKVDIEQLTNELSETLFELRKTIDCLTNPFILIMRSGKKGTIDSESSAGDVEGGVVVKSFTAKEAQSGLENLNVTAGKHTQEHARNKVVKTKPENFVSIQTVQNEGGGTIYDRGGNVTYVGDSAPNPIIKARVLKRLLGSRSRSVLNSLLRAGLTNTREHIHLTSLLPPEQEKKEIESGAQTNIVLTTFILNIEPALLNLAVLYGGGGVVDVDRNR
jgi:hypothetical protein